MSACAALAPDDDDDAVDVDTLSVFARFPGLSAIVGGR
jgi:hypothetical protein